MLFTHTFLCVLPQPTTKLFIDGKFVESKSPEWLDIHNPVSSYCTNRDAEFTLKEIMYYTSLMDYILWAYLGQVKTYKMNVF